jgi:hypothetical protein
VEAASDLERQGGWAYERLADAAARFFAGAAQLSVEYGREYLLAALADRAVLPPVPAAPTLPPPGPDRALWTAWYQLIAAWIGQEQAWFALAYQAMAEQTTAGRIQPDALRSSTRGFLEHRLAGYLDELQALYSRFASDVIGILNGWFGGSRSDRQEVIAVSGRPGSTATTAVLVENGHSENAAVACRGLSLGAFTVAVSPATVALDPGETATIFVFVGIPFSADPGLQPAGWITVHGHGERDLVTPVRAEVVS